jgi:lipid-binding SYLF domain-containing protein
VLLLGTAPARADDAQDARQRVEKAKLTVEQFQADSNMGSLRDLAKKAKGTLILPQMVRAAFIVGGSGGSGMLIARDEKAKQWRGLAFYTLGGASFGFQAGADAAEVIILAMTERGVTELLSPQVKLGADISVAAGPVGAAPPRHR